MEELKTIPVSRAKTAWGLLQDVKRAILAEPKRANMHGYVMESSPCDGGPACGTVGCVAGWIALLTPNSRTRQNQEKRMFDSAYVSAEDDAMRVLGNDIRYRTVGPGNGHEYVFNAGGGDSCASTRPGTKAHARAVVARINKFMRINEKELKARKLANVI